LEQETERASESRVWEDRAAEVIAQAREMPPGARRRAALREAGRLRVAAALFRWLTNK
jgi:hypothetical protein